MRKDPLITNHYYHVYNRGADKRDIFMNNNDISRFVLSVKEFNRTKPIGSIREKVKHKYKSRNIDLNHGKDCKPLVSIMCYCFNPNHFHFILKQEVDGGISEFIKRLLGGYTKYFNQIHNRNGVLFQGKFKSKLINDDQYFLKIRPYVNVNYLIHDIPENKKHLVLASDREYNETRFDLVSPKEALQLLEFYGGNGKFKMACMGVIEMLREERGLTSLLDEDLLP